MVLRQQSTLAACLARARQAGRAPPAMTTAAATPPTPPRVGVGSRPVGADATSERKDDDHDDEHDDDIPLCDLLGAGAAAARSTSDRRGGPPRGERRRRRHPGACRAPKRPPGARLENPWRPPQRPCPGPVATRGGMEPWPGSGHEGPAVVSASNSSEEIGTSPSSDETPQEAGPANRADHDSKSAEATSLRPSRQPCRDGLLYSASRNIALQLGRRALRGRRLAEARPPRFRDASAWLELAAHTRAGCRRVAWDHDRDPATGVRLGTLLACAFHDGWVRVYEMDTIGARELEHRRRRQQQQQPRSSDGAGLEPRKVTVEPFLYFQTLAALDMQWNPYQPDELAVQTHRGLQVFDLAQVQAWLQDRSERGGAPDDSVWHHGASRDVPCRTFPCPTRGSAAATILFLPDERHVLTATDDTVTCFNLLGSGTKAAWALPWQRVTSMRCVPGTGGRLVLLGSSAGRFGLVDVQRLHRPSFSLDRRPTLVAEWPTCLDVDHPSDYMGISHIHMESFVASATQIHGRLTWTTSGGWVISSSLDLLAGGKGRTEHQTVRYATKPVKYVNVAHEEVKSTRCAWSIPANGRCRSHGTGGLVAVEHVAQMTRVLPQTDQRVLSSTSTARILQDCSKHQLVLMWSRDDETQTSLVPLRDAPLSIAIHPQHSWIAVASNSYGVYLLHARQ